MRLCRALPQWGMELTLYTSTQVRPKLSLKSHPYTLLHTPTQPHPKPHPKPDPTSPTRPTGMPCVGSGGQYPTVPPGHCSSLLGSARAAAAADASRGYSGMRDRHGAKPIRRHRIMKRKPNHHPEPT